MKDCNCIFCKLANGEIPTNFIYEDEDFKVILDNSPATKGHALVLPKEHYANIYEIEPEVLAKAVKVGQKVIKHVAPILKCDGYNLLQNNGEIAGQTIFHFHLHLIPRYESANNTGVLVTRHETFSDDELKEISKELRLG